MVSGTAADLVASLTLGWNLGNALDAPEDETAWGNPRITPELLQSVADAGFDAVRIPVTWSKHMSEGPDFTIDPAWLNRVEEVVGYARDAGMVAIINIHHDGAEGFDAVEWLTLTDADGNTTDANNAAVRDRFVKVWTQIAAHFADHEHDLLFEGMNEIHVGYGKPDPRHLPIVNELNQAFIDTVRASGQRNADRVLVVPGYNTSIDHTLAGFVPPDDTVPGRLILSVHNYDPYLFALRAEVKSWGQGSPDTDQGSQEAAFDRKFDRLKAKFIDHGLPVILGEYGCTNVEGAEDYRRYYVAYVTASAKERGILPFIWDNGGQGTGAEQFGLFDRATGEQFQPELIEAMVDAGKGQTTTNDLVAPDVSE